MSSAPDIMLIYFLNIFSVNFMFQLWNKQKNDLFMVNGKHDAHGEILRSML